MYEKVIEHIKGLLDEGVIQGFLGLRKVYGAVTPYFFTKPEELEDFSAGDVDKPGDTRYPLNKMMLQIIRKYPSAVIAVLVRGCDERNLVEMIKWNQIKSENVIPVGIGCPEELAEYCECRKPWPDAMIEGTQTEGKPNKSVEAIEKLGLQERLEHWKKEFQQCIKCYGCRDVCPVCFCKECTLSSEEIIPGGEIPPANPMFHLVRATHMAGRCIDCGLCEEACPAHIHLRTLYKEVAEIVDREFQYRPGYTKDKKSPLNIIGDQPEC